VRGRSGARRWRGLLLSLLGAAHASAAAQSPPPERLGDVTLVAPAPLREGGRALARTAAVPRAWPGLGTRSAGPFTLLLVADSAEAARASAGRAPAWAGGVTLPEARMVLLRADADDRARVLQHELAHLVLHDALRGARVPRWFAEGWAGWAAGEFGRVEALGLSLDVAAGPTPTLRDVDAGLAGVNGAPARAYALATTAVLTLARFQPDGRLEPLLGLLAAGTPFEEAVLRTTGRSLDRFDEAWGRDLRRRYGWLVWGGAVGFWLLVAAVAMGGAVLRRRRDAVRRAALDEGWPEPDVTTDPETPSVLDVERPLP
jgi:hypothetical protein